MRIELRKEARISAHSTISYQPAAANGNGSDWQQATLLDLGKGGAALRLEQPHRLHEALCLDGLPASGEQRQAIVRWVRKDREHYHVGVEFL